jgi:hypothetical protein
MTTLADELAADLDFSSDEEEQSRSDIDEEQEALDFKNSNQDVDMDSTTTSQIEKDNYTDLETNPNSVRKVCKLLYSKQTQDVLKVIVTFFCELNSKH